MPAQEVEKQSSSSASYNENFKVEETAIDNYVEDDGQSITNEFGHGEGSFLTGYFSVTCVVAGTGTLGLPHAFALGGWLGKIDRNFAFENQEQFN